MEGYETSIQNQQELVEADIAQSIEEARVSIAMFSPEAAMACAAKISAEVAPGEGISTTFNLLRECRLSLELRISECETIIISKDEVVKSHQNACDTYEGGDMSEHDFAVAMEDYGRERIGIKHANESLKIAREQLQDIEAHISMLHERITRIRRIASSLTSIVADALLGYDQLPQVGAENYMAITAPTKPDYPPEVFDDEFPPVEGFLDQKIVKIRKSIPQEISQ